MTRLLINRRKLPGVTCGDAVASTIHPPIRVVLFVVTRIAEVSFETMSRAILPWLIPLLVVLTAITIWPRLSLWLPNLLLGR